MLPLQLVHQNCETWFWIILQPWLENDFFFFSLCANLFWSEREKIYAAHNSCAFKLAEAMTVH